MGKYDAERAALGLPPLSSGPQNGSDQSQFGKYAEERSRLMGEVKTYTIDPIAEANAKAKPSLQEMQQHSIANMSNSPVMQQVQKYGETHPAQPDNTVRIVDETPYRTDYPGGNWNPLNLLGEANNYAAKPLHGAAKVFEELYTPGAGAAAVGTMTQGAEKLVTKLFPALERSGSKLMGGAVKGAEELPKLGDTLLGSALRGGATEAVVGTPLGAAQYLSAGGNDLGEAAKQGAYGAVLGGTLGASAPLVGGLLKKGALAVKDGVKELSSELPTSNINPFAKQGGSYTNPMDTRSHISTKTKGETTSWVDKVRQFYNKTADALQPINRFDKQVEEKTGQALSPSERSYMLALNSKGSDTIAKHILTERMVDPQGNVIGDSLKSIAEQLPKGKTIDFEDYLINKHAVTRMSRGEKVFPDEMKMTPEKSAAKAAEYEKKYPQFKELAQKYYDFQNNMVEKWLVEPGIISRESFEAMKEANPYYVPNKRLFSELERTTGGKAKSGFGNQTNPIKSATGSQRKIVSPLESTIEHVDQYVKTAKRNEVMQSLIKNVEKNPEAFKDFVEIVKQPEKQDDLTKMMMDGDGIEEVLSRFNENFDKALKKPDLERGNVLRAFVDGKPVHIKVNNPQLLESLTGLAPQAQNFIIKSLGQVTRVMKVLTTGANPVFSLTRNVIRDIPTAYINSKTTNNPAVFAKDYIASVIDIIGNRSMYQSFKAIGGGHSSSIAADRNLLAQSKREILPQNNKSGILKKGFNMLENLNNAVESAPRLAEFRRSVNRGGGDYNSKIKGLYEANDVTVNFNRSGQYAKDADAVVPYMNAALQGLDKFVRSFIDSGVKGAVRTSAKSVAAVTVPALILYAFNHDDPNYQKLSNYTKDNFFLIPKGDGTFYRLPKSREVGVPFGSSVERILRKWKDEDPAAFKDFASTIQTAFVPPNPLTDTVAEPLIEVGRNKNFVGAPIVPGDLARLSKPLQYDSQTSEVSKFLGEKLNQSPKQIDHLIRSYGGVIGQLGIPATTQGSTVKDTLIKQVTADPTFSNDIMRDFYDKKEKLDRAQADYKATGQMPKGYNNDARLLINRVADKVSDIRKEIKQVQASDLPNDEKKAKIKELTDTMNEMAKNALK